MSNPRISVSNRRPSSAAPALGALALCFAGCASTPDSLHPGQETYDSPEAAVGALVEALRADSPGQLEEVLGPEGGSILHSGDPVADRNDIETFLAAYDRGHEIAVDGDSLATLLVGDDDWPMPIPIVSVDGAWHYDTESGKEEVLARRIGDNELAVITVCRAIVDAQEEYASRTPPDATGARTYARKFLSTPGARDGLYWEARAGDEPSPLGPLVAEAVAEGYSASRKPQPFHGYLYRMLTEQGSAAPGGAKSYLDGERMTGGFAVVAWPAEYDNSGIMTFLVSDDGVVYQKDLGPETARLAEAIKAFDPGEGWEVVQD